MLGNIFPLDSAKPFTDQEKIGHNRYHPEIPPVDSVKPGDTFRVDSREWFDGAIKNDDSVEDILNAPMKIVHGLSGQIGRASCRERGASTEACAVSTEEEQS